MVDQAQHDCSICGERPRYPTVVNGQRVCSGRCYATAVSRLFGARQFPVWTPVADSPAQTGPPPPLDRSPIPATAEVTEGSDFFRVPPARRRRARQPEPAMVETVGPDGSWPPAEAARRSRRSGRPQRRRVRPFVCAACGERVAGREPFHGAGGRLLCTLTCQLREQSDTTHG